MLSFLLLRAAAYEEVRENMKRRRKARQNFSAFEHYSDHEFIKTFRFDKATTIKLCQDLQLLANLKPSNISVELKVLTALAFYATGSYQRIVGVSANMSQTMASRCIKEVTDALNEDAFCDRWIHFPSTIQKRTAVKLKFYNKYEIPGVLGCVDGTHVALVKPPHEEELYFNRKGYHSLNVQIICDSSLTILAVNAKFGGASHDSYIWGCSQANHYLQYLQRSGESVWLLGDSGYPQRSWLMTPILNAAQGSREEQYTKKHVKARNCVERCIGVLKMRWRCLLKHRVLHYHPEVVSRIVTGCCVLHNIAIAAGLPEPLNEGHSETTDFNTGGHLEAEANNDLAQGRAVRNQLVRRMFP